MKQNSMRLLLLAVAVSANNVRRSLADDKKDGPASKCLAAKVAKCGKDTEDLTCFIAQMLSTGGGSGDGGDTGKLMDVVKGLATKVDILEMQAGLFCESETT